MKNEGRIMTEIGGTMNELNKEPNKRNTEPKTETPEKTVAKNIPPHNNTLEAKSGKQGDEIRIKTQDGEEKVIKITPEMDRRLNRLYDFEVEVEVDGKPVKKTAYDVLDMMGSLAKEGLTQEEVDRKIGDIKTLHDKLEEKYYAGSSYGNELRGIFDNVVFQGIDTQKWSDQIKTGFTEGGQINLKEFAEKMGAKTGDNEKDKFDKVIDKVIKQLPLPEGVKAAPMITIDKDGKLAITPAPAEAGKGGSEIPKTPDTSGGRTSGSGEGGNGGTEKEKEKFDWWKYGNAFLFLVILFMGAEGWYAKMWEQFAERAR